MKIDWYCPQDINCGKPWSDETLEGQGLGGAETEVVILSRELAKQGHDITVYVTMPLYIGMNEYGVRWQSLGDFDPYKQRDVFILHRSWMWEKDLFKKVQAKAKVFFSCDQYTAGGNESRTTEIYPYMDEMWFISEYHKLYTKLYASSGLLTEGKMWVTDLGIMKDDYLTLPEKEPNSLIFCSVPMRGLDYMVPIMSRIWSLNVPAKLTITSDYRLWGSLDPGNWAIRDKFKGYPNVRFLGKISRRQLVEEQKKAEIMAYSCNYDENFCIAAAECMAAGAVPVTTKIGALETTVADRGVLLRGLPQMPEYQDEFANTVARLLTNKAELEALRTKGREYALENYTTEAIINKWVDRFTQIIERKV